MKKILVEAVDGISKQFEKNSLSNLRDFETAEWAEVLQDLGCNGTNLDINRNDPMGDGDQSLIKNDRMAQKHRDVWAAGGNTSELIESGKASPFVLSCVMGDADLCLELLLTCKTAEEKSTILETRFSILRLPPLLLTLIGYASIACPGAKRPNHLQVVKLLLEHGARCDARDLCGKTFLHYAIGPLCREGDTTALNMADLCIQRANELQLPPLVNMQDRFGAVALLQAIMMTRVDLVTFLCVKHGADVSIKDVDGFSATSMSKFSPKVANIVASNRKRSEYCGSKMHCMQCNQPNTELLKCGKCKVARYCSRECQVAAWPTHKSVCKAEDLGIVITIDTALSSSMVFQSIMGKGVTQNMWNGDPPKGVKLNEFIDVKIQAGHQLLLYDKSRLMTTFVNSGNCPKFAELSEMISKFAPCDGKKAYFKAKITGKGVLFVSTQQLFVCKW